MLRSRHSDGLQFTLAIAMARERGGGGTLRTVLRAAKA
jgi:hypothetical protein